MTITNPQITIKNIANIARSVSALLLLLSSSWLLTACGALPDKPRPSTSYDFGPGFGAPNSPVVAPVAVPEASPERTASAAPGLPALVLLEVESSPALDGNALLYRLAYADAQALHPYAQARWSMPPAQLLRQQVRAQLGAMRPLLLAGETVVGAAQPWNLRLELEEFSQVFESASASSGLVRLRASVTQSSAQGERLLGQRGFSVQRPAPSPDAPGGVRALSAATQSAVAELAAWLAQLPQLR